MAVEQQPAAPEVRQALKLQAPTTKVLLELPVPRTGPARPKTGLRSRAAPRQREARPSQGQTTPEALAVRRASAGPTTAPVDSTKLPVRRAWRVRTPRAIPKTEQALPEEVRLEDLSGPESLPTRERARRAIPKTELTAAAPGQMAMLKVQELPMTARRMRLRAVRAVARPSSEPGLRGLPELSEIPTSELGPESPRRVRGGPRESPTSELERRAAMRAHPRRALERSAVMRAHPRRATWLPRSWPALPRAGPSLDLQAAERQSSGQPGLSAALRPAEPRSKQLLRFGSSATRGALGAPPSCACVAHAQSSSRGQPR
jgi:hypothetical protein